MKKELLYITGEQFVKTIYIMCRTEVCGQHWSAALMLKLIKLQIMESFGWMRWRCFPVSTRQFVPEHKDGSVKKCFIPVWCWRTWLGCTEPWPQPHPAPLGWTGSVRSVGVNPCSRLSGGCCSMILEWDGGSSVASEERGCGGGAGRWGRRGFVRSQEGEWVSSGCCYRESCCSRRFWISFSCRDEWRAETSCVFKVVVMMWLTCSRERFLLRITSRFWICAEGDGRFWPCSVHSWYKWCSENRGLCFYFWPLFFFWLPQNSTNSPGPMKGPTVAARLKHLQQGSLERPKTRKQKEDFPKVQGQQQVFHF